VEELNCIGKAGLLRIIDPLTSQLMSSSCHQYEAIRGELRRVLEGLGSLEEVVRMEVREVRDHRGKEVIGGKSCGRVRDFEAKHGNVIKKIFEDS
jgi:hypothetical protein